MKKIIKILTPTEKTEVLKILIEQGYKSKKFTTAGYPCWIVITSATLEFKEYSQYWFRDEDINCTLEELYKKMTPKPLVLEITPKSIAQGQSEFDSWSQYVRLASGEASASHPCQDKCSNFKDEECGHCLVKHESVLQDADEAKFYAVYLDASRYVP